MILGPGPSKGHWAGTKRYANAGITIGAGVLLPVGVFAALVPAVAGHGALGWDMSVLNFFGAVYKHSSTSPLEMLLDVSTMAGAVLTGVAVVSLWAKKRRAHACFLALAVGVVLIFDLALKAILARPPLGDPHGGYSFPSGNAMASLVLVAAIAFMSPPHWRRRALAAGVPAILAYGAALVAQGWHYPSDVLGGWCLALAWVNSLWLVMKRRLEGPSARDGALAGRHSRADASRHRPL